jgi:hypothetical protein
MKPIDADHLLGVVSELVGEPAPVAARATPSDAD